jgi:hypothetical protein
LVGLGIIFGVYAWVLIAMGQKNLYVDLLRQLFRAGPAPPNNGA